MANRTTVYAIHGVRPYALCAAGLLFACGGTEASPPPQQGTPAASMTPMAPPAGPGMTASGSPMGPAMAPPTQAPPVMPGVPPVSPTPTAPPSMMMPGAEVGGAAGPETMPFVEPEYTDGPLTGSCPDGFTPRAGMNSGFMSEDKMREFVAYLPADTSTPRPVFVGITGTEQQSSAFISAAGLEALTGEGWIVLAPVRLCTSEGRQQECLQGVGESTMDGWVWEPWNDGSMEDKWNGDAGPDVRYLENMVRCVATEFQVDQRRIYLGGISAGGSFTNRNLTYNSKFWAGGVPASGMWYISAGNDSVTADNADELMDGWCCPRPVQEIQMYSSIAIILFGGPNDNYTTRDGQFVEYRPEAQAASNLYDSKDNVAVVTCQGNQGHIWPRSAAWNTWMAQTLSAHPKGTPKADFVLPPSPSGFECKVGRYTDLY